MTCAKCGGDLMMKSGAGRDPDTGYYDEDYLKCVSCGEVYDLDDLEVPDAAA